MRGGDVPGKGTDLPLCHDLWFAIRSLPFGWGLWMVLFIGVLFSITYVLWISCRRLENFSQANEKSFGWNWKIVRSTTENVLAYKDYRPPPEGRLKDSCFSLQGTNMLKTNGLWVLLKHEAYFQKNRGDCKGVTSLSVFAISIRLFTIKIILSRF